ncbi:MAG TPA: hypothetical protein VGW38_10055, partial [Chloroflexota bacterium]|nr:hypothetical protein [Chloroflexota bacterium]
AAAVGGPPSRAPAGAVLAFYGALERGDLDTAAALWSPRMKAQYPPAQFVYERFRLTHEVAVRRAEVISVDQAAGRAVVAVDLIEISGDPPATYHWVGTWEMTLGPAGWLLDQPNLAAA